MHDLQALPLLRVVFFGVHTCQAARVANLLVMAQVSQHALVWVTPRAFAYFLARQPSNRVRFHHLPMICVERVPSVAHLPEAGQPQPAATRRALCSANGQA